MFIQDNPKWKVVTKNKMDNPRFVDEEKIPLVDEDYDNYSTPNINRVDETSFMNPAITEATSALRIKQKVKRDKLAVLYTHLNVTGNIDLTNLDQFKLMTDTEKGATIFEFYNGDRLFPLTKETGKFLASKTLRDRFGGVNTVKKFLGIDRTPPSLGRLLSAASKLKAELPTDLEMESIPLKELSYLVEDMHVKTREASQNTDLDMREFLGIHKALQGIQGEFLNNISKLTEIDKRIKRDTKKLQEVENDYIYTNEQSQRQIRRLEYRITGKAKNAITKPKRPSKVARIKQTLEKVFDKNIFLLERTLILIHETDCNCNRNTFCLFSGYHHNCTFCHR